MPEGQTLGTRLRFERELRGWNLLETGERLRTVATYMDLELSEPDTSAWENGRLPTTDDMRALAALYELPNIFGEEADVLSWPEFRPMLGEVDRMKRREFLEKAAVLLGGIGTFDPERLSMAMRDLCRVDVQLIKELRDATKKFAVLWDTSDPATLLAAVRGHTVITSSLMSGSLTPELRGHLLSVSAEASALAGWLSQINGNSDESRAYLLRSKDLAYEAGDRATLALAYLLMSDLVSSIPKCGIGGDPEQARNLVGTAEAVGLLVVPPAFKAWILLRSAEEKALSGQVRQANKDLEMAERTYAHTDPITYCDPFGRKWNLNHHTSFRGNVAQLSGDYKQAQGILEGLLWRIPYTAVRHRSAVLADLGSAYAQAGQLDQACELLSESLVMADAAGNVDRRQRVVGIRNMHLTGWEHTPELQRLDEQLNTP